MEKANKVFQEKIKIVEEKYESVKNINIEMEV